MLLAGFFNNYLLILLSLHESHLHTLLKCNLKITKNSQYRVDYYPRLIIFSPFPLLTYIDDSAKKLGRYRNLVQLLPPINYNTLKKLMAHLVAISSHAGKNLMPNYNLGAIWGPSLLTVDSMEASTFAQTSNESDVCRDLIDYYKILFDVPEEELKREAKISQVLEKINQHDRGRCLLKQSG